MAKRKTKKSKEDSTNEFILRLSHGSIYPFVSDNRLRYSSSGPISQRLLDELKERKEEMRLFIKKNKQSYPAAMAFCMYYGKPWHKELVQPPAVMSLVELQKFLEYLRDATVRKIPLAKRLFTWQKKYPGLKEKHVRFFRDE